MCVCVCVFVCMCVEARGVGGGGCTGHSQCCFFVVVAVVVSFVLNPCLNNVVTSTGCVPVLITD